MAIFNPDVQDVQSDYTRSSQGYRSDTSLGGLFENAGNLFETAVKGADALFKKVIRNELTTEVDEARDHELNKGIKNLGETVPKEIDNAAARLNVAKKAYDSGQIGGPHYSLLLDLEARRMRSKYPGYREYIDNVMQDLTGINPANKAIQELRDAANKGSKEDTEYKTLQTQAMSYGLSAAQLFAVPGQRPTLEVLRSAVANDSMAKNRQDYYSQRLDVSKKEDDHNQRVILNDAVRLRQEEVLNTVRGVAGSAGLIGDRLQGVKSEITQLQEEGKPIPAAKQAEMEALAVRLKDAAMKETIAFLQKPRTFSNGVQSTFGAYMKPATRDEFIKSVQIEVDAQVDFTKFKSNAVRADAMKDEELFNLFTGSPAILRQSVFTKEVSPQIANTLAAASPSGFRTLQTGYLKYVFELLPEKTTAGEDLTKMNDHAQKSGLSPKERNDIEKKYVEGLTNVLKDATATPKDIDMVINKLYGEDPRSKDFYSKATEVNKEFLFQKLVDPKITDRVFATANADIIKKYVNWADARVSERIDAEAKQIKGVLDSPASRWGVKYDPKTLSFSVTPKAPIRAAPASPSGDMIENNLYKTRLESSVNSLNRTIAHYRPVAQKMNLSPDQMSSTIERIFKDMNKVPLR